MRIIDLLNKIANNEEVPNKIVYNTRIFRYNKYNKCYIWNCNGTEYYLSTYYRLENILNDEIETIEEKPKKIEEIDICSLDTTCVSSVDRATRSNVNKLLEKVEELTNAVNYLLEKERD